MNFVTGPKQGLEIGQYKTWTAGYGLRTTDYGLGIKHGLRYKTRTKHYGLSIKYGLGYEQAHTGCKLYPLLVLRVKATSSTCFVTWPMRKMRADQLH